MCSMAVTGINDICIQLRASLPLHGNAVPPTGFSQYPICITLIYNFHIFNGIPSQLYHLLTARLNYSQEAAALLLPQLTQLLWLQVIIIIVPEV